MPSTGANNGTTLTGSSDRAATSALQQPQPFTRIGDAADAAAALQQRAHRVQAGVGVKRRPDQLQHHRTASLRPARRPPPPAGTSRSRAHRETPPPAWSTCRPARAPNSSPAAPARGRGPPADPAPPGPARPARRPPGDGRSSPSTPLTAAAGRACNSKRPAPAARPRRRPPPCPGGARPDTRAARLAANPYTSSWAVSRYTSPRCTPTRTVISIPKRRCACSLSRATSRVISSTRQHRAAHIVLMRGGVTEHRQQPVTLVRADMALIAVHDRQDLLAVATHQHPVRLGLDPGRQHRRIHQIGEKNRQPANLTSIGRGGQADPRRRRSPQSTANTCSRQRRRGHPITTVDRRHRPIQQLIDRRRAPRTGITVPRRAQPSVAHPTSVALWVSTRAVTHNPPHPARLRRCRVVQSGS